MKLMLKQPSGNANAQTQMLFQKKSQRTFSTIVMAINTRQLYDQSKDAWDALRNHFEHVTLANTLI